MTFTYCYSYYDLDGVNVKILTDFEIDKIRQGWYNPRKISFKNRFSRKSIRINNRNKLPPKFRKEIISETINI